MAGLQMDIDSMRRAAVSKDNSLEQLRGFILAQGPRQSANEHLVPEALFDDPSTTAKEVQGVSAVKALKIAMQQGQKIFTINQTNIAQVFPLLHHRASVIEDVQNAVSAGKIVTISEHMISANGWTGSGYIIVDPVTGAGAYLIGGGMDGAIMVLAGFAITFLATEISMTGVGLIVGAASLILGLGIIAAGLALLSGDRTLCKDIAMNASAAFFGALAAAGFAEGMLAAYAIQFADQIVADLFIGVAVATGFSQVDRVFTLYRICGA